MPGRIPSPPDRPNGITRRAALGGLVAAMMTPTLIAHALHKPDDPAPTGPSEAPLPRQQHSATILADGSVLVAGGQYLGPLSSAQIYNPATGEWSSTGPLNTPRYQHAAVAMGDGSVLVAGGFYLDPLADAELYDPKTGVWTPVAPLNVPRFQHSAILTPGGAMVFGGFYRGALSAPEIFDGTSWHLA